MVGIARRFESSVEYALANLFSVSDVIGNGICDMFMWLVNYLPNAPSFFRVFDWGEA